MNEFSNEEEVLKEIKNILKNYYLQYSKKAILAYEQTEGKLSDKAVHEIRDALDHIAIAVSDRRTSEQIGKDLNAAREHFRRLAIDPIEYLAEERFGEIVKLRNRGLWWWKFLLITPPLDIDKKINKISDLIVIGRENKGVDIEKSFDNMWKAYDLTRNLNIKMQPAELRSRLFALGLGLLCALLGVLIRTTVAWLLKI
jgi:hypothetical protein